MKLSILAVGALTVASVAQAGPPVYLNLGQAEAFQLNTGRSVVVTCSMRGGSPIGNRIPLAQGESTTLDIVRNGRTVVYCSVSAPVPGPVPVPVPPPLPPIPVPPSPIGRTEVLIYSGSDRCDGTVSAYAVLVGGQDVTQQCTTQLGAAARANAWSVRVNGTCIDISDTDALSACSQTSVPQNPMNTQVTFFSNSDRCSGAVSASKIFSNYRSQGEQCMDLNQLGRRNAWSVRVADQCIDISDTDVVSACMALRLPTVREPGAAEVKIFGSSDQCTGQVSAVGTIRADSDLVDQCMGLTRVSGSENAWSISVNGACQDISDTDVVSACLNVRVPSRIQQRQVVFFSGSDQCTGAVSTAGYFDPRYSTISQCQALRTTPRGSRNVWSIRVDDRCTDISDTDLMSACVSLRL